MKVTRIAVGMSGGVDSSVSAAMLKQQGNDVIGLTMKTWSGRYDFTGKKIHGCYTPEEDNQIARIKKIADIIGIKHYTIDVAVEYQNEVLDYFISEYHSGRTPNPCLKCNAAIKFGSLQRKARENGIDFDIFATGHYVNLDNNESGRCYFRQAKDLKKDQSYFLAFLKQEQLKSVIFPLGNYYKHEVKEIGNALKLGLDSNRESQDFLGGEYSRLIEGCKPGPVIDKHNKIIGEHKGIPFYTIGQRKGLGSYKGEPLYVISIDVDRNTITAGNRDDLYRDDFIVWHPNWMAIPCLNEAKTTYVKIRNAQIKAEAVITPLEDNTVHVKYRQPQFAITPGQAAVFYDGDIVLGGGTIL